MLKIRWSMAVGPIALGLLGLFLLIPNARTQQNEAGTWYVHRIYTGPDGVDHVEEINPFANGKTSFNLEKISDASLHISKKTVPGKEAFHDGPKYQYVITLTGTGELELAGGKKIPINPGGIDVIEDVTGQGHITRTFRDRVQLVLPFVTQPSK